MALVVWANMRLEEGTQLGSYQIVAPIGKGGMGEVYRAIDTRLDRDVAIKVLPDALARDTERSLRFEREAKLLASLNHPNIAHLYGFETEGDTQFLVLECVEGETLASRLKRGPISVEEAIVICRSIALALEAAHDQNVVHRDLKPGNVLLRLDGQVKVLDFGLAKAMADESVAPSSPDSPTITANHTRPGVMLGTAPYMSPEQARGRAVDKRTDIWSFGVILYECLTGEMLFGGETPTDSISAVLQKDPDWNQLPVHTPPNVRRVLDRCVTKDVRRRLHHIADARIDLDCEEPPAVVSVTSLGRYGRSVALLVAILAVVLATWLGTRPARLEPIGDARAANPLAGARFSKVADFTGAQFDAAISPDGRFVAYVSNHDGQFGTFVSQVTEGTRRLVNATDSLSLTKLVSTAVRKIGFNSGGSEVWFAGGSPWRLRTVPLLGGAARNFLGEEVVNVAWSPDGRQIAYHEGGAGDPLFVADADGANSRLVISGAKGIHQHFPAWSTDGQWVYVVRGRPTTMEMDLWRVRPDGGALERLTWRQLDVRYPTPIDETTVLYCALDSEGAGPWIWTLDVRTRVSRRASIGLEKYRSLAASADGRRLVATLQVMRAELWTVPILDRVATDTDAKPLPGLVTSRALAPRLRGPWLYYLSSRGSGDGLWRYHDGNTEEIWRGSATPLSEPAAVSPEGDDVALVLRKEGTRQLHVLRSDGSELRELTVNVDVRGAPEWSPDGKWIIVGGNKDGAPGLFKIPANGGTPVRLATREAWNPVWSPVGDLIVYCGAQVNANLPLRAIRPDGTPVEFPKIFVLTDGERMRFLPDGSALVYMKEPSQDFWSLNLDTMEQRRLTQLKPDLVTRSFDITPDGRTIVFDRVVDESDIVLIERTTTDSPRAGEE